MPGSGSSAPNSTAMSESRPISISGRSVSGAPGVGKTEAAKAIGAVLSRNVIRLQCYEGIDAAAALYEWNYPRQMLAIRQAEGGYVNVYSEEFLLARPLLEALNAPDRSLLLIDEIDRSDQEFEAFLLENSVTLLRHELHR